MLLAIDVGNTNTVMGVFEGDELRNSWRVKTDARNTADELALTFRGLLADIPVSGIAACSTVPAVMRELRTMLERYYPDMRTVLVEPGVRTGVSLLTDNPKEVGTDRSLQHRGGAPPRQGARASSSTSARRRTSTASAPAATSSAARWPPASRSRSTPWPRGRRSCARSSSSRPRSPIGKNTVESLQSGILYGFAGQVDGMVRRLRAALVPDDPDSVRRHRHRRAGLARHRPQRDRHALRARAHPRSACG